MIVEEFQELLALTQKYLSEHYSLDEWLYCREDLFCAYQPQQKRTASISPKIKSTPPLLPITPPQPLYKESKPPPAPSGPKEKPATSKKVLPTQKVAPTKIDFTPVRELLKQAHPHLSFIETIPSDSEARPKRKHASSKADIPIITMQNTPQAAAFLEKVAQAIRSLGVSSTILSVPNHKELKEVLVNHKPLFVLIDRGPLYHDSLLAPHYQYDPKNNRHHLYGHPIYPLPSIQQLSQNPHEKARLWQEIKNHLP